jgi:hypothetical protein
MEFGNLYAFLSQIMYLLLSSGILSEIANTILSFQMYTTPPMVNYEASHNIRFSAQLPPHYVAGPLCPRIHYMYSAVHITDFLTVLTLVHEDTQFNKYDKNIIFLFSSCLLPCN